MNPLDYLRSLAGGVPAPVRRVAGQIWNKVPTAINPLRTRQPTTSLGRIGKELNPLNPRNVAIGLASEAVRAIAGKTLPPEQQARVEYMMWGPQIGTFLNVLDAGTAGATPLREQQLIAESNRYFAQQAALKNPTQAATPAPGPRVDQATTQALDAGYAAPQQQAPTVTPVTPTAPPTPTTFPLTPQGQFERYFQTPEFDYVFGAASRGQGAPTSTESMLQLAKQLRAEKETDLPAYYRAQSAAGRSQMDEIKQALGYAEGSDLAKWAEANPMLAQRLFAKKSAAAAED